MNPVFLFIRPKCNPCPKCKRWGGGVVPWPPGPGDAEPQSLATMARACATVAHREVKLWDRGLDGFEGVEGGVGRAGGGLGVVLEGFRGF